MLALDKNTSLKIHIIELLDGLQEPISLKELQEKIGYASIGTIRLNCKELQTIIDDLYVEESYSLKLRIDNRRGIQLERYSTNLQTLTSYLYKQDLSCEILLTILAKRKISAIQFCMEKNISESKLRRKIKEINSGLTDYSLYISCSTHIRLRGREVDIRRFYFLFMRVLYHQFTQIDWINTAPYLKLARKIEDHLKIASNPTNWELISFWLLVINQSHIKKSFLSFNHLEKDQLEQFNYPNKPAFLKAWNANEWKFFIYAIYSSEIKGFDLQFKRQYEDHFFDQIILHWIVAFQNQFKPLSADERKSITNELKQHITSLTFFHLKDSMVNVISKEIAINEVRTEFPYYYQRFEAFWQEFTASVPEYDQRQMRLYSLLTCVTLYSLENCLPKISVYVFSEHSELFRSFLTNKIDLYFKNQYSLTFVEEPQDAQIIIGTSPTCEKFLLEEQEHIIIRSNISTTDYIDIETILERLVQKDLSESSKSPVKACEVLQKQVL